MDTSNIDIKAVIDQLCCIAWKKPVRSHGETVYKGGPCPFCHEGTDRFAIFPEGEKPHFYCGINGNGCGVYGDVITFVQLLKGYSALGPAIRDLQEMGFQIADGSATTPCRMRLSERDRPVQKWQDQGNAVVHAGESGLWSPVGKEALDYLHSRGLTDETIRHFRLGYWPRWTEYKLSDWGLEGEGTFWLRPSILIPCYAKDVLWSINQRITAYAPKEREQLAQGSRLPRYRQVRGSGNGLFNVDAIRPEEPLFVTEGEIDAMTITQETGYSAVATGSTQGAKVSRWTASLSIASHLLIAFDNDGGKGEEAAKYWTETIFPQKAFYCQPWAKDVNEMLQSGQDLKLWASMGVELASRLTILEAPVLEGGDKGQEQECRGSGLSLLSVPTSLPSDDPLDNPVVQEVVRLSKATVISDPSGYTLLQHVQKMRSYSPATLPSLPRAKCPHRVLVESKGRIMRSRLCKKPTLAHGWCEEHVVSAKFLDLGAQLNYPGLDLSVYCSVGAGVVQWEGLAEIFDEKHLLSFINNINLK